MRARARPLRPTLRPSGARPLSGLVLGSWPGRESGHNRFLPILLDALAAEGVEVASFPDSRDIEPARPRRAPRALARQGVLGGPSSREAAGLIGRLLAKLAARPAGCKLVWMVHDLRPHDGRWFKRLAWPPYAGLLARLADGALTLSEGTKATVAAAYPALARKPLGHIWHPYYPGETLAPAAAAAARAGFGWTGPERVFGYCGQLRPYKGVEELIRAFGASPTPTPGCCVAGRPMDAGYARTLAGLGDGDRRIPPPARGPGAGAVPGLPRRLRPRRRAVPALPALGLDRARLERRPPGADPGDAVRRRASRPSSAAPAGCRPTQARCPGDAERGAPARGRPRPRPDRAGEGRRPAPAVPRGPDHRREQDEIAFDLALHHKYDKVRVRRIIMADIERLTVTLPADLAAVLRDAVNAGDYASTSEAVREAVRDWRMKATLDRYRSWLPSRQRSTRDWRMWPQAASRISTPQASSNGGESYWRAVHPPSDRQRRSRSSRSGLTSRRKHPRDRQPLHRVAGGRLERCATPFLRPGPRRGWRKGCG